MSTSLPPAFPEIKYQDPNLLQILKKALIHTKKAAYYLIFFSLLGLILGIVKFYSSPIIFQSSLTAYSVYLSDKRAAALIGKLNDMCGTGGHDKLGKVLNIPTEQARQLVFFKVQLSEILEPTTYEKLPENRLFEVIVGTKRISLLDTLNTKIVDYLDNSEYVTLRYRPDSLALTQSLAMIETKLKQLNSNVEKSNNPEYYNSKMRGGRPTFLADPASSALNLVDLYTEKKSVQRELLILRLKNNVITPLGQFVKKQSSGIKMYIAAGLVIGFLIGFGVYAVRIFSKEWKNY